MSAWNTWAPNEISATILNDHIPNDLALLRANFAGTSSPANPVAGQLFYNTDSKITYQYNGTAWVPLSGESTNMVYVSKTGVSGNSGKSSTTSVPTFNEAVTLAGTLDENNRCVIMCLDGGYYELDSINFTDPVTGSGTRSGRALVLPDYVSIYAPNAAIFGLLVLGKDSKVTLRRSKCEDTGVALVDYPIVSSNFMVSKTALNSSNQVFCSDVVTRGVAVTNWSSTAKLQANLATVTVLPHFNTSEATPAVAVGNMNNGSSAFMGDIFCNMGKVVLGGEFCMAINCNKPVNLFCSVDEITGGTNTFGVKLDTAVCYLNAKSIAASTGYSLVAGDAKLYLSVAQLVGAEVAELGQVVRQAVQAHITVDTFNPTATTYDFVLSQSPKASSDIININIDGQVILSSTYTIDVATKTVTITDGVMAGEEVEIKYFDNTTILGVNGFTFTPEISGGILTFTNDGGLTNPAPYDLRVLPKGWINGYTVSANAEYMKTDCSSMGTFDATNRKFQMNGTSNFFKIKRDVIGLYNSYSTWSNSTSCIMSSFFNGTNAIFGVTASYRWYLYVDFNGKLIFSASSNGTSYDIASSVSTGTFIASVGVRYYFRVEFTGTRYNIQYSLDGLNWTTDFYVVSSLKVNYPEDQYICSGLSSTFKPSEFYPDGCKIICDGITKFDGSLFNPYELDVAEGQARDYANTFDLKDSASSLIVNNNAELFKTDLTKLGTFDRTNRSFMLNGNGNYLTVINTWGGSSQYSVIGISAEITLNSLETIGKTIIGSTTNYTMPVLQVLTTGKLIVYISSNGTAWDISNGISTGTFVYTLGTKKYFRILFTGTQYDIQYSSDEITWTTDFSVVSSVKPKIDGNLSYGAHVGATYAYGTLFIDGCKVICDGVTKFDGSNFDVIQSTWGYLYKIYNPTTNSYANHFDTSLTAPTLPEGYTKYVLVKNYVWYVNSLGYCEQMYCNSDNLYMFNQRYPISLVSLTANVPVTFTAFQPPLAYIYTQFSIYSTNAVSSSYKVSNNTGILIDLPNQYAGNTGTFLPIYNTADSNTFSLLCTATRAGNVLYQNSFRLSRRP